MATSDYESNLSLRYRNGEWIFEEINEEG